MYIPSYDFRIFDLPMFSPLQAQEFGAATSFSANTPTSYIDYSINQLGGLLDPRAAFPYVQRQFPYAVDRFNFDNYFSSFQDRSIADVETEVAKRKAAMEGALRDVKAQEKSCPEGYKPVSVFGIFSYCGKGLKSDGEGTMGNKDAPAGLGTLETAMNSLPQGSGLFLIAVVAIIFLLLFVRR